jgi:hypothetical protein
VREPSAKRIVFVPGKNPKPAPDEHRRELWRCLRHGVARADPAVAEELAAAPRAFTLAAWNYLFYRRHEPLGEDLSWIEALLGKVGPSRADVREALSFRRRTAKLLYTLADLFHFLIPLLPDPAVKSTIHETARYFTNEGGVASRVREVLKAVLRPMLAEGERVLLIGHSMGSVIAYDALWEMWHEEHNRGRVDLFLTLGSPLGMRFTRKRLLGAGASGARRYPGNIRRWVNISSQGDLTALDTSLRDDFAPMLELGLVDGIADVDGGVFNYFRNREGLNVHRSYGYLVNPRVGEVIARWWRECG